MPATAAGVILAKLSVSVVGAGILAISPCAVVIWKHRARFVAVALFLGMPFFPECGLGVRWPRFTLWFLGLLAAWPRQLA